MDDVKPPRSAPTDAEYIRAARAEREEDGYLEIDDDAQVLRTEVEHDAWVAAWVWVGGKGVVVEGE